MRKLLEILNLNLFEIFIDIVGFAASAITIILLIFSPPIVRITMAKILKVILAFLIIFFLALMVQYFNTSAQQSAIHFSNKIFSLEVGNELRLRDYLITSDNSEFDVQWQLSDAETALIDSFGIVTALKPGIVTVIAYTSANGNYYEDACNINVTISPELKISPYIPTSLYIGDKFTATAYGLPADVPITWNSSNIDTAEISASGEFVAHNEGSVIVTALAEYNGKLYSDSRTVTVDSPVISFAQKNVSLFIGQNYSIISDISYEPINNVISLYSYDDTVAYIDSDGTLLGVGSGETTIAAEFEYNGVKYIDECNVLVYEPFRNVKYLFL